MLNTQRDKDDRGGVKGRHLRPLVTTACPEGGWGKNLLHELRLETKKWLFEEKNQRMVYYEVGLVMLLALCFALFLIYCYSYDGLVCFSPFLFCFVLFCFVLFCFVLFCFVLFCFVLFCFVLFCFVCVFFVCVASRDATYRCCRCCRRWEIRGDWGDLRVVFAIRVFWTKLLNTSAVSSVKFRADIHLCKLRGNT